MRRASANSCVLRSGKEDGVDHMNHAVRLHDVRDRNLGDVALGVGDLKALALFLDREGLALDGLDLSLAAAGLDLLQEFLAGQRAGDDVVCQNGLQLALVFRLQQVVDRARRELLERLVGRREDRGPWS